MRERNIIIIMLIIIILLLLVFLLVNHLGTIEVKAPTGNVDIYDITIIEKEEVDDDKIIVHDENGRKINIAPLKIFDHKSYYAKNDVIAPGTENSYQFIIRNNNEFAIIYDLNIMETNEFDINMKFRLKQNDNYILGNDKKWVTAQELKQTEVILAQDTYNVYTLDWKWFESENDTKVGENIEANYKLSINFDSTRY